MRRDDVVAAEWVAEHHEDVDLRFKAHTDFSEAESENICMLRLEPADDLEGR
ncbi:MAG: hypothetical protein KatS3mg102_2058 [Planctomycetota bacterium]|nr:MAG: hypothetical protein KatS3mg102_2058 [Planctomycetota bacterium]